MSSYTGLSLHQRLAALSGASAFSSTPHHDQSSSLQSPMTPKKSFFNVPWSRRKSASDDDELEVVQEVMSKLIFQAGVDFETRPMVVVNASALPDPRQVNYDILLSRVLSYLDLYVESDYTVIFFAAGGNHTPGWNWVWKAYRSLSRKYRKNLKRLYVVHSTFYSKMLFSLAGAVISPKFFRKITYISSLSSLAYHIPLTQIDIPPAVYSENLKYESSITLPTPIPSSIFGVPLEDIMGYEGEKGGVPRIVRDAVAYIRETGMEEEGIFRRSPSSALLRAAREAYDRGNVVSLDTFGDPHLAAVLLKKYLRDLPQPIFPEALYPTIRRCPPPSNSVDMAAVTYIRDVLLPELPPCVYILLSCVLQLLHETSLHSGKNRMDAYNLAIVISPNLVKGSNPARDVMMCMAQGSPALFDGHSSPTAGGNFNAPLHTPRPQVPMMALLTPSSSSTSNANIVDPQTPVVSVTTSTPNTSPPPTPVAANNTTLGTIIKLCIQRFYEVFDEVTLRERVRLGGGSGSGWT
ncbi:RhoGAP-domain-containing protein [Marasmius fiardii PR-910]|nr:RhoGAP-domain-containing protein [Marasmius fiardii PR-910]